MEVRKERSAAQWLLFLIATHFTGLSMLVSGEKALDIDIIDDYLWCVGSGSNLVIEKSSEKTGCSPHCVTDLLIIKYQDEAVGLRGNDFAEPSLKRLARISSLLVVQKSQQTSHI